MDTGPYKNVLRGHETFEDAYLDYKLNPQVTSALHLGLVLNMLAEAIESHAWSG